MSGSRKGDEESQLKKCNNSDGRIALMLNARGIDIEIFGATLVGLSLELGGTALAVHGRHALGSAFKFLGAFELLLVLIVYIYRFYTNAPGAGRMALLIGYLILLFCMVAFVMWSAIDSVLYP